MERYKILVVDDDPQAVELMGETLTEGLDSEIILACSSEEAAEILRHEEIAVLFCDMEMPVLDGTAILRTARLHNPSIISILVTGQADKGKVVEAVNEGGIWKYLEKPFRPQVLLDMAHEALDRYDDTAQQRYLLKELANMVPLPGPVTKPKTALNRKLFFKGKPKKTTSKIYLSSDVAEMIDPRFKVLHLINKGGSGMVFKAHDSLLDMDVAIKILKDDFTYNKSALKSFFEEARIAMQLSHKHLVRLHNLQETNGFYYLVMEYIEGSTLRTILNVETRLPIASVLKIVDICADALGYAHRRNVYHRDLKPSNIMITREGVLKIIDFGIACLAGNDVAKGKICGTPYYISPEQVRGVELDQRSDVFSMGVTVHEMLTGMVPFDENLSVDKVLESEPVVSRELPDPMIPILERAMAKDRRERYPDILSFYNDLNAAVKELKKQGLL